MQRPAARRTVDEWEAHVGQQLRDRRLDRDLTQQRLAHLADVSVATIQNLERGAGSSLATLIKVVRALALTDWLERIAPDEPTFSPLAALHARQDTTPRRRASRGRSPGDNP